MSSEEIVTTEDKDVLRFLNSSPGKNDFLSTYHNTKFVYTQRLDNKPGGKTNDIEFSFVEQALTFISYASKPGVSSTNESFLKEILTKVIQANTPEKLEKCVPKSSLNQRSGKARDIKRIDWDLSYDSYFPISYLFMFEIYVQKFEQNPELKQRLLNTGNLKIEEISSDYYMGIGKNKNGKNYLGKILMCLREHFKNTS